MREHEVPTHVQAEDRVLLWFTFPQIVAMTAVCALSYGVYRYAPVGPSEVRMALAVLFGLFGIAMVAGKIGGRRLPLVAADLLRYRLGPRRYVGPVSQLVRNEAPAQKDTVPSPLSLLAMRFKRNARRLRGMMESARRRIRRRKRSGGNRQNGRMPFRPHRWFRKGCQDHEWTMATTAKVPQARRTGEENFLSYGRRRWPSPWRWGPCLYPRASSPTMTGRTRSTLNSSSRYRAGDSLWRG